MNEAKHGIDFNDAQSLWQDPCLLKIPARTQGEARSLCIGRIGSTYWSAIVTERTPRLRIISVRRARNEEIELYENL